MEEKAIQRTRSSAVCFYQERVLMVDVLDRVTGNHHWMPPGGEVHESEDLECTAERETLEETGVIVRAYRESKLSKTYGFRFKDQLFVTTNHFFLCEYEGEAANFNPRLRKTEIFASEWVSLNLVFERLYAWEEVQTAVYELLHPLLRGRRGTTMFDLDVSAKESLEDDEV
jgi:8-oxo-dGTP pyrophosphatase MutT (NUDIX family)